MGDIDHDGWPDLYVANIGDNRLYRNNGDGTFDEWPIGGNESSGPWTTSCVVADIDGDGHVDLYDVNYLSGPGVFTKICRTQGVPFACHPNEFDGAQDRFWRGDGEGGFVDATSVGGFVNGNGKGLGIVAARYPGGVHTRFAAGARLVRCQDAVANFFFAAGEKGARDEALLRGVAYDRDGRPQACMGVAAGDADGDGRLDLFITNFYAESNVLYPREKAATSAMSPGSPGCENPVGRCSDSERSFSTPISMGDLTWSWPMAMSTTSRSWGSRIGCGPS
ncbi:MAG: hypothetical protein Ct9H300mP1_08670 [Planctomycetaceae bacterium]|nr:MAG: hypothetical protein Ct9H300mP1_08670 [Planctomycetaceae bacterium]